MIGSMPKVGMLIFGKYEILASDSLAVNFSCQPHKKLSTFDFTKCWFAKHWHQTNYFAHDQITPDLCNQGDW